MMGVSGLAGDPGVPPRNPPMPPLPLGRSGTMLAMAMNRLGWHWWPSDTTVATVDYEGRARCINLGHCTPACAQGAKASTDITYWPAARRAGVELRTHCRVREITMNEHGMAAGVVYYDADGIEQFQAAEVVVLACRTAARSLQPVQAECRRRRARRHKRTRRQFDGRHPRRSISLPCSRHLERQTSKPSNCWC